MPDQDVPFELTKKPIPAKVGEHTIMFMGDDVLPWWVYLRGTIRAKFLYRVDADKFVNPLLGIERS